MKHQLKIASALLALSCGSAHAMAVTSIQTNAGLFTTKAGVCTVDFDTSASLTSCAGVTYSAPNGVMSHVVTGSVGGQYAQPNNDPTPYLTVGGNLSDDVTIDLLTGANYFGFYAGSIDSYNSITFSGASGSVTESGTDILARTSGASANGQQSVFFNLFTDQLFTSVTLSSSSASFETDNHAFGIASPVPEPTSIALLGLGTLALVAGQRRRQARKN